MSIGNQTFTLNDVMRLLARHRWRCVLPLFFVTMAVLFGSQFLPRHYESSAIFERRNDPVISEMVNRGVPHSVDTLKQSVSEELRGMSAIERTIDDLGLAPPPDQQASPAQRQAQLVRRQQLLHHIRTHLRVFFDISTPEIDRIRVVLSDTDPNRAPRVVNQLVRNYIDTTRRKIDKMLTDAAGFFQNQITQVRQQISRLEAQRLQYEMNNPGLLPGDQVNIQNALAAAEKQLALLQRKNKVAENHIARLQAELSALGDDQLEKVVRGINPDYSRLETRLTEYQDKLEHALIIEKMTDRHPTVVALKNKIAQIQTALKDTPREIVTQRVYASTRDRQSELKQALLEATATRQELQEELQAVDKQTARLRTQSAQCMAVRSAYSQVVRQIEQAQQQLSFWEDNHRRAALSLQAKLGRRGISLKFIRPSGPIHQPISPDPMQVIFAAIGLGLLAAVGSVVLAERSDQTLHDLTQANTAIGVPILGSVAQILTRRAAFWQRLCHRYVQPTLIVMMLATLAAAAYLNHQWLRQPRPPALRWLLSADRPTDQSADPIELTELSAPTSADHS